MADTWVSGKDITEAHTNVSEQVQRTDVYTPSFWQSMGTGQGNYCVWTYMANKSGSPSSSIIYDNDENGNYFIYDFYRKETLNYLDRNKRITYLNYNRLFTDEELRTGVADKEGKSRIQFYKFCAEIKANKLKTTITKENKKQ